MSASHTHITPVFHFLFEQSGTFKRCAQELGYTAFDYDVKDDFGETDYKIDLFHEIDLYFDMKPTIFDCFGSDDIVMAFFPCVRFCADFKFILGGTQSQLLNKSERVKLETARNAHEELSRFYWLLCSLCIIALEKGFKLVIENPATGNYLTHLFPLKPQVIYRDRRKFGDWYTKPTMFYFVGWNGYDNAIFMLFHTMPKKDVTNNHDRVDRSMISPQFAKYFILSHLLPMQDDTPPF